MTLWFLVLGHVSILAYGLLAGVFLAFSDFIMRALSLTSGAGGVEAMQAINREVFRYVFMATFLGMAPVSAVLAGHAMVSLPAEAGIPVALAAILYLFGAFGVTVVFNVPLNEALAAMDRGAGETRRFWTETYLPRWTFWNSVRTGACAGAALLLLSGMLRLVQMEHA